MSLLTLPDTILDRPVRGTPALSPATTLREALGDRPTVVVFVRHLG